MRIPLRLKFILIFLIIATLGFAFIAVCGSPLLYARTLRSTASDLYRDANYLSAAYRVNEGQIPQSTLEAVAYTSGADIWVMDLQGNVIACTGTAEAPEKIDGFDLLSDSEGYYRVGSFFGAFREPVASVYAPLTLSISPDGYVVFHYPDAVIRKTADTRLIIAYLTYLLMMALIILLMITLGFIVIRPTKQLLKTAREYAGGNLSYPSAVHTRDEYGAANTALTELSRELKKSDEEQHRFLANISHDFRSPLTSIRGYLTAIEDGTIPPEMQGKYIDIVLNETERLTKLANSLLEMTALENGLILERSAFDIHDMIRGILPTFEGSVNEKRIEFYLTFDGENRNVYADRARIEQVLYNLIDNAIKFSPTDSKIDITTTLRGEKLFISVRDHGVGIEKSNLPKIWDRFYKTDVSRGRDKKGTGLGLSIVREIIQAHRENIDVISTPGVGTEFIFTLQAE